MMKSLRGRLPSRRWLFLPPLLIGLGTVAFLASREKELERIDEMQSAKPLEVMRVFRQPVIAEAVGYGTTLPVRTWTAVSEVGGRIVKVHPGLRSGRTVEAGATLFEIDQQDYLLRVQQREAEVGQAEATLTQLKVSQQADAKTLEIEVELQGVREKDLARLNTLESRKAASVDEVDAARSSLLAQKRAVQMLEKTLSTYPAQIASAEASLKMARARLDEARRDVDRTQVVAPYRGILSGVSLEPDQIVAPGQSLFQVLDTSTIEIESQFSMAQLGRVWRDSPDEPLEASGSDADEALNPSMSTLADVEAGLPLTASATLRSGNLTLTFPATPVRLAESMDDRTRTLGVVVRVENSPTDTVSLLPGAYCEVTIFSRDSTDAFLIPRTALFEDTVWVVDRENRLRRREVTTAFPAGRQMAISEGLLDGDLIVVQPPVVAIEGSPAKPILKNDYSEERIATPEGNSGTGA